MLHNPGSQEDMTQSLEVSGSERDRVATIDRATERAISAVEGPTRIKNNQGRD